MEKEIVISWLFSGTKYIKNNLGHEVINLFKADDGNQYIYLMNDGKYGKNRIKKNELTFDRILFVKHISGNSVEVVALAKNLEIIYNPSDSNSIQERYSKTICYNDIPLESLFKGDKRQSIFITFKANYFRTPKKRILIDYAPKEGQDIKPNPGAIKLKNLHMRTTTNYINANLEREAYDELCKMTDKEDLWEDTIKTVSEKKDELSAHTLIDVFKCNYDENAYSNAIAYFMSKYPELVREWINNPKYPHQPDVTFKGKQLRVQREVSNEETKGRADIHYSSDNEFACIIENKLHATLDGLKIENGHVNNNKQLKKYEEHLKKEANDRKIKIGVHLLLPNYHPLLNNLDSSDGKYPKISGCVVITYKDLYDFLKAQLPYKKDSLFREFVDSLERHTHQHDDSNYYDMIQKFQERIIQNNKCVCLQLK